MSEDEALELLLEYQRLRDALQMIADHAEALEECQKIAREALAQTEATE